MGGKGSGNRSPRLENLTSFPRIGTETLASRLTVRFSVPVHAVLSQMSSADKQAYIRAAVEEKMRQDGLL